MRYERRALGQTKLPKQMAESGVLETQTSFEVLTAFQAGPARLSGSLSINLVREAGLEPAELRNLKPATLPEFAHSRKDYEMIQSMFIQSVSSGICFTKSPCFSSRSRHASTLFARRQYDRLWQE